MGKLVADMTPEQLERQRERHRVANMTPEQLERERDRKRVANMSPEQLERKRERNCEYRATHFRLKVGDEILGFYPCTPEQRERIKAFRKEQHGVTATP